MAQGSVTKTMSFACAKCGYVIFASPTKSGSRIECPACGGKTAVPQESEAMATDKPVSKPCPRCEIPLRLVPSLHGKHVRCNACQAIIAVSTQPWALSVLGPVGDQQGVSRNCPSCSRSLRLYPALDGKHVRCKECAAILAVSADPWTLTVVEGGRRASVEEETALPVLKTTAEAQEAATTGNKKDAVAPAAGSSANPSRATYLVSIGGPALILLLVVGGLAWLTFGRGATRPIDYLPRDAERIVFVDFPQLLLVRSEDVSVRRLPLLPAMETCELFLHNAAIRPQDVEEVVIGGRELGTLGTVVVYRLKTPIDRTKTMKRSAFRSRGAMHKREDWIGGVPVVSIGPVGIAFPDDRTIVTGERISLGEALEGQWWPAQRSPAFELAAKADAPAAATIAETGPGAAVMSDYLDPGEPALQQIKGATTQVSYKPAFRAERILELNAAANASAVADMLQKALAKAVEDEAVAEPTRKLLATLQIEADGDSVRVEWNLPPGEDLLGKPVAEATRLIFGAAK